MCGMCVCVCGLIQKLRVPRVAEAGQDRRGILESGKNHSGGGRGAMWKEWNSNRDASEILSGV